MRFFCLIATEDRLWNMKKAFRMLQQQYGDAIQGSCYSLWDVCQKPDAYAAMMEEARGCQYAIVYFHGGAQILPDFRGFWKQITAWMPAYFESSLPDEIAELMPSSGVTPEEYRTVQSYFQYADADNFAAMFLAIASARFDMPCPVPPPKPPLSRGFYRPGGPIPREEEEAVLRGAAESGRPVGIQNILRPSLSGWRRWGPTLCRCSREWQTTRMISRESSMPWGSILSGEDENCRM